ncbi:ABC transporter permease [Streptomyces sp. ATexAB-D23]|uniref:ABC transporter permease n=1 Tax=unclassified Streptomyces TaxID=2593676 RepID=UPI0003789402|nr:ABC transporter permease [Streptomyces sp. ATexAB-D23]MYY06395.1 ABC transporter permease [Streptomyces sp. SID4913]
MSTLQLRGPARVVARQQRGALWAACALVVLGIAFVIGLRTWVATTPENCADGDTTRCGDSTYLPTYARSASQTYLAGGGTALLVLSVLIGVFVAGPLIARELENGTFRFAWAQSVPPARWLAARLALPAVLATAAMTVLLLVYRWGRTGVQGDSPYELHWSQSGVFPALGPVVVAYALFAVAVGALCAVLVRRTLPAMGLTAVVLTVVMYGFGKRRYELWPTVRDLGENAWSDSSWPIESGMLTPSGKELHWKDCFTRGNPGPDCLRDQGGVTNFVDHHPPSHFWPLQLVETGILLALAAGAVALAFRILRRHHA